MKNLATTLYAPQAERGWSSAVPYVRDPGESTRVQGISGNVRRRGLTPTARRSRASTLSSATRKRG